MMFSSLAEVAFSAAVLLFGLLELLGENLDVTPDDRQWIAEIVDEFGRSLA